MKRGGNRWVPWVAALLLAPLAGQAQAGTGAGTYGQARQTPASDIDAAVRALQQAALQSGVATDAREVALLRLAHDDLSAALPRLHGSRKTRASWLLEDLDRAIEGASARFGEWASPDAEEFGESVPDRNQLDQLAIEAQELQRRAPVVHRLVGTAIIGTVAQRDESGATATAPPSPLDVQNRELLSWPLGDIASLP